MPIEYISSSYVPRHPWRAGLGTARWQVEDSGAEDTSQGTTWRGRPCDVQMKSMVYGGKTLWISSFGGLYMKCIYLESVRYGRYTMDITVEKDEITI